MAVECFATQANSTVIVSLRGDMIGRSWVVPLRRLLTRYLSADDVHEIALDLRDATAINLEGLASVVTLIREAGARGKRLVVRSPSVSVASRLEVTGLRPYVTGERELGAA